MISIILEKNGHWNEDDDDDDDDEFDDDEIFVRRLKS